MKYIFMMVAIFAAISLRAQHHQETKALDPDREIFSRLLKAGKTYEGKPIDVASLEGKHVAILFSDPEGKLSSSASGILYALQKSNENVRVIRIGREQAGTDEISLKFIQLKDGKSSDGFSAVSAYAIKDFPTMLLLDEAGTVIGRSTASSFMDCARTYAEFSKKVLTGTFAQDSKFIEQNAETKEKALALATKEREAFLRDLDAANPYTPQLMACLQGSIALDYAKEKNLDQAKAWLAQIQNRDARWEAAMEVAGVLKEQKSYTEAQKIIEPLLDRVLAGASAGKLALEEVNGYSKLAGVYCSVVPLDGNQASYVKYLKPVFETCGFFPGDAFSLKGKPAPMMTSLLVYHYAKALPASDAKQIAAVLASYLNSEPDRKVEFLKDFARVTGLAAELGAIKEKVNQRNYQNLYKLCLKPDMNGKVWGLHNLGAKYILLDFWGSWCSPCRASHPHLKEVYSKYKGRGLEMIGISAELGKDMNKNRFSWKRAIAQDGINWIQLLNPENQGQFDAFTAFDDPALVKKYIYDMEGNFLGRFEGKDAEGLDKKLAELMPDDASEVN